MVERNELKPFSSNFFSFKCDPEKSKDAIDVLHGIGGVRLSGQVINIFTEVDKREILRAHEINGFLFGQDPEVVDRILKERNIAGTSKFSEINHEKGEIYSIEINDYKKSIMKGGVLYEYKGE